MVGLNWGDMRGGLNKGDSCRLFQKNPTDTGGGVVWGGVVRGARGV